MRAPIPEPIGAPGRRAADTIEELKAANAALAEIDQESFGDADRKALLPLAESLAAERLLGHPERAVRLLASCCVAHVLRLCAPDAPYAPLQLAAVFGAAAGALRILADPRDAYYPYAFALAESLATFRSVALLLDVPAAAGGEDLQRQVARAALDLAPAAAQTPVRTHLAELVATLVDECDGVSPVAPLLVDALSAETTPGATRALAATVFASCGERLAPALASALSRAFSAYAADATPARLETLRAAHARTLPLVQHSAAAAAGAVALVEEELRSSDAAVRSLAVEALAEHLFVHASAWEGDSFSGTFSALLARADDRAASVRLAWSRVAPPLLSRLCAMRVHSATSLRDAIAARLLDTDARVREAVLASLGAPSVTSLTVDCASAFTPALVADVAQRARDRVEDVRLAALAVLCGLAKAAFSRIADNVDVVQMNPAPSEGESSAAALFSKCVDALFALVGGAADRDLRVLYAYFVEHSLLAPGDDARAHARLLVAVHASLSDAGRAGFQRWLREKARAVRYFAAFVALVRADAADARLAVLAPHLADCFRAPLDALNMLRGLADSVFAAGLPIRALFERLAEPSTGVRALLRLQTDAAAVDWAAIDARIQPYLVTFVFRRAALLSVSAEAVAAAAAMASAHAPLLVEAVLAEFPGLAGEHCAVLEGLVASTAGDLVAHAPHLAAYARFAASARFPVAQRVLDAASAALLCDPNTAGARRAAKAAAAVLVAARANVQPLIEAHPGDAVRWQALVVLAAAGLHPARLASLAQLEVELAAQTYASRPMDESHLPYAAGGGVASSPPGASGIAGDVERLDRLDARAQCAVLAVRVLREALLAMAAEASQPAAAEASQPAAAEAHLVRLRAAAPALVSLACAEGAPAAVCFAAAKALVALVPRPTLAVLRADMARAVLGAHAAHPVRMAAAVLRLYARGRAGLVHAAALFLHWPAAAEGVGAALADVRARDHRCEPLGSTPADTEISSASLRRWEHLFVVALVLAALVGDARSDKETVSALVDAVATEATVSFLFDAAVALKGVSFVPEAVADENVSAANRRLYCLSEQTQAALRARAAQHRWALRAVAAPLALVEPGVLAPLASVGRVARNVQRSYLGAGDAPAKSGGRADAPAKSDGRADAPAESGSAENAPNAAVRKSSRRP